MAPLLAQGQAVAAFRSGFDALAALLAQKGVAFARHGNELADGAVVEEGA